MIALVTASSLIVGGIALALLLGALILVKTFGDSRPHS